MKQRFHLRTYFMCLTFTVLIFSCGKDDDGGTPPPTNNAPEINAQSFNASEAIDDATVIGKVAATDADNDALTFSIKTDSDNLFEITDGGDIGLQSGKALDFETKTSHTLSIDVTDGEATANAAVTITVVDVNENQAPVFAVQTFTIGENAALNTEVGILGATDPDGDTITYSWDPNGSVSAFALENLNGVGKIRTADNAAGNLDFETTSQYIVSVIASDGELSTQANITINVTDENDTPETASQVFTVAEDIDETVLIGQIVANDQDNDVLTFSVDIDYDLLFEVSNTGEIKLRSGSTLDFETKTSHQLDIFVSDGTETIGATITINVTDVDEISGTVSTIAGTGTSGTTGGASNVAQFNFPGMVVEDSQGNIFVADINQQRVRKIDVNGTVTTLDLLTANPIRPRGLAIDANDNLYISDFDQHYILKVSFNQSGTLTLEEFAGVYGTPGFSNGSGTNGLLKNPMGMVFDNLGNLIVADWGNSAIRKIDTNGNITTLAGNGTLGSANGNGTAATFERPIDVTITSDGAIFVADVQSHLVRRIATNGSVTTFAGTFSNRSGGFRDGVGTDARFSEPAAIIADSNDNLYVADAGNNTIRKIGQNQNVTSLTVNQSGNVDGSLDVARFNRPAGLGLVRGSDNLYIGDGNNHTIRKIEFQP